MAGIDLPSVLLGNKSLDSAASSHTESFTVHCSKGLDAIHTCINKGPFSLYGSVYKLSPSEWPLQQSERRL